MSAGKPATITDDTGIPIKWAFALVGAAVGLLVAASVGLMFLGGLTTRVANAEKSVADIQLEDRARTAKDIALEGRLTSIEAKLDIVLQRLPRK